MATIREYLNNEIVNGTDVDLFVEVIHTDNKATISAMSVQDLLDSNADYLEDGVVNAEKTDDGYILEIK